MRAVVNSVVEVVYKGGWLGIFAGENQRKAMERAIGGINGEGRAVVAAVIDRWSIWRRLLMLLVALVTLGFYVRSPNILLITAPA